MRLTLILLLAVLFPTAAFAQIESDQPFREGAHALLFQIGPNFVPTSLGGATISVKRHTSELRAQRLSVTASADYQDYDVEDVQNGEIVVDVLFLRYRPSNAPAFVYFGYGPTVEVNFFRTLDDSIYDRSTVGLVGAAAVFGLEWPINRGLGVIAEVGGALLVGVGKRSLDPIGSEDAQGFLFRLDSRGGRLGVSLYF
jgi:hypothetical protein